jgi:ABC-2 type transport system ATP-binding protein
VGAPKVTLAYRGTTGKGKRPQRVFAQLVDTRTGLVLGNQITPIPVRLDGKRHTVSRPLELVAQTLSGRGGITLQLVATTPAYAKPQLGGKVRFSAVTLRLPRVRG